MNPNLSASPRAAKPTFSPTKIVTFLQCSTLYRYIYVDHIGRFYQRPKAYFSFGATLHTVLQAFHAEGARATPEEMIQQYQQSWQSAGYASAEEETQYQIEGMAALATYHDAVQQRLHTGVQTLLIEKFIQSDMGSFILNGRVDRVDRWPDGSLEIVDYKSGRLSVSQEDVANDLAMGIYQLIIKRLYPDTPVRATIYCLRSGQSATAELASTELEACEKDVRTIVQDIMATHFNSLKPQLLPICEECDFRTRCERYWKQKKQ